MLVRVDDLPDAPLAAAAAFYARHLAGVMALAGGQQGLTLVFAPADHTHAGWRLAAVHGLARALAPQRVNALASDSQDAIAAAQAFLAAAPGITGQVLQLDDNGAGAVLG
jgi:hypothetical protein